MLYYNLTRLFKLRGIDRPYYFLRKHGFAHIMSHKMAKNEIKQFRVSQIENLCGILHCLPNDLYDWKDDGKKSADNHLAALRRDMTEANLKQVLGELQPKQVEALLKEVKSS